MLILDYNLANTNWELINPAGSSGSLSTSNLLHIQDQKASGTSGGTFTTGAWQTRVLNTELTNTITSMSTSQSSTLVGGLAPEFELSGTTSPGQLDSVLRLKDYRGRWLILMFYPRDFSLVCPTELSAMNTRYDEFLELGAEVIAVSTDSIESHQRWLSTPKAEGGLGTVKYPLASDTNGDVARARPRGSERWLRMLTPDGWPPSSKTPLTSAQLLAPPTRSSACWPVASWMLIPAGGFNRTVKPE